jgi:hypothetical protein
MIRTLFSLMIFAMVGILGGVLTGHLWSRFSEETEALGFSGIYERLEAAQAGFADDAKAYRAAVTSQARQNLEASALEE